MKAVSLSEEEFEYVYSALVGSEYVGLGFKYIREKFPIAGSWRHWEDYKGGLLLLAYDIIELVVEDEVYGVVKDWKLFKLLRDVPWFSYVIADRMMARGETGEALEWEQEYIEKKERIREYLSGKPRREVSLREKLLLAASAIKWTAEQVKKMEDYRRERGVTENWIVYRRNLDWNLNKILDEIFEVPRTLAYTVYYSLEAKRRLFRKKYRESLIYEEIKRIKELEKTKKAMFLAENSNKLQLVEKLYREAIELINDVIKRGRGFSLLVEAREKLLKADKILAEIVEEGENKGIWLDDLNERRSNIRRIIRHIEQEMWEVA